MKLTETESNKLQELSEQKNVVQIGLDLEVTESCAESAYWVHVVHDPYSNSSESDSIGIRTLADTLRNKEKPNVSVFLGLTEPVLAFLQPSYDLGVLRSRAGVDGQELISTIWDKIRLGGSILFVDYPNWKDDLMEWLDAERYVMMVGGSTKSLPYMVRQVDSLGWLTVDLK